MRLGDQLILIDEHWDGRGQPYELEGEAIPLLGRIVCLAQTVEVFYTTCGVMTAYDMAIARRGRWLDPAVVDALVSIRKHSDLLLTDDYDSFRLSQLRGEFGFNFTASDEAGVWFTKGLHGTDAVMADTPVRLDPIRKPWELPAV